MPRVLTGANDKAPLPNIGQILAQVLNPNAAAVAAAVPAAVPAPVAALPGPLAAIPAKPGLPPGT